MLASKHGGWFLNEIFVYSEDITQTPVSSKYWEVRKMTTKDFGQNSFQEVVFKAFKNRKQWFRRSPAMTNSHADRVTG